MLIMNARRTEKSQR